MNFKLCLKRHVICMLLAMLIFTSCKKDDDSESSNSKNIPEGIVTTFAGSGVESSVDGEGTAAAFDEPNGMVFDKSGNLYVIDEGTDRIRKITPSGTVSTFVSSGLTSNITSLVFDDEDNIYTIDQGTGDILKITPSATVSTFVTGVGSFSIDIAIDSENNLYVFNRTDDKVKKVTPAGIVSDYTDTEFSGQDINGLAFDKNDNLYLTSHNDTIYKYTPSGDLSTYAANNDEYDLLDIAYGMVFDEAGNLYAAGNRKSLIYKVTPKGVVSTFAGSGIQGSADGTSTSASFDNPNGIVIDDSGVLYVSDHNNNLIRKIE